jgi:hypothetical protein
LDVQKKAGVIIGTDYPKPMVQHDVASKDNMAKMNDAYAAHKAGGGGGGGDTSADGGTEGLQVKKTGKGGASGAGAKGSGAGGKGSNEAKPALKRGLDELAAAPAPTKKLKQTKLI